MTGTNAPADLASFARAIHRAAAELTTDRLGDKVLIAALHQRLCADWRTVSLLEFKVLLWRAHNERRIKLVRVDMPRMFNAAVLADSELCVDGASNFNPLGWSASYHAVIDPSHRWDTNSTGSERCEVLS